MDQLPQDLWQFLAAWCTPRELLGLRALNKTVRALIAQLAFPRKIREDTARRWFRDPAFQARVAATMARPERDLYVTVIFHEHDNDFVHNVSAVAVLRIKTARDYAFAFVSYNRLEYTTHPRMPHIVVCGPIARLSLWCCTFAHDRFINADLCATVSLVSWSARDYYEFPRQLVAWYLYTNPKKAYAVATKHAFREDLIQSVFLSLMDSLTDF